MRKLLRVGVVLGGKLVDERLLATPETITIGQSLKNTFAIPSPALPRSWPLLRKVNGAWQLQLDHTMEGRLSDGPAAVRQLAGGDEVALGDKARGKIMLGEVTVLFQFVTAPPVQPRPQLPRSVRRGLLERIDPTLALILLLSFGVHGAAGMYVVRMDRPQHDPALPDVEYVITGRLPVPPPEPTPTTTDPDPNGTQIASNEPPRQDPPSHPGAPTPPRATRPTPRGDTPATPAPVNHRGVFAIVGVTNPTAKPSKFQNVTDGQLPGGDMQAAIDRARDEQRQHATNGDPQKTNTKGHDATITGRDRPPVGPDQHVTNDHVQEERPTVETRVEKPEEIENEGLDPDAVMRKIRASYYGGIEKCYDSAIKDGSGLKGRVEITLSIGKSGGVSRVDVVGFNETMDACIQAKARSWRFANKDEKKATFMFPFSFRARRQ